MPANIEIKARVHDAARLRTLVETLSDTPGTLLWQEDTFFYTPRGRLKLRTFSPSQGELIAYERADTTGPKVSTYERASTTAPEALKTVLALALETRGVVRKQRVVYMIGQTRVHLDTVEGLGHFVELEVVLRPEQTIAEGETIAAVLMQQLAICHDDLLPRAYIDLLTE